MTTLKNFFLTLALLNISLSLNAAIIYTDITPDSVSSVTDPTQSSTQNNIAPIDFNNDGTIDCNFRWDRMGGASAPIWWVHGETEHSDFSFQSRNSTTNDNFIAALSSGDVIDDQVVWLPPFDPFISTHQDAGFQGLGDRYIGIKLTISGNPHFGWILVSFDQFRVLTIKSYAFEDSPNTPITAGDIGNTSVLVNSISIQGQNNVTNINEGATLQMVETVLPSNASDPSVSWSVINGTGSASINTSGLLTGISAGTVTVTATANDGSGISGNTSITINPNNISVQSITVEGQGGATTVNINSTLQMEATVSPSNATNQNISWTVDNSGKASIDANGVLNGISTGNVLVTATATDGSGVTGSVSIEITDPTIGINTYTNHSLTLYPNPTNEILQIQSVDQTFISIYNEIGQLVWKQNGSINHQIDVSDWNKGIYFLVSESENYTSKTKIIIN